MASDIGNVPLTPVDGAGQESDDIPHVTHEGELVVGTLRIKVYQLSNGQRIIPAEDFARAMEWLDIDVALPEAEPEKSNDT